MDIKSQLRQELQKYKKYSYEQLQDLAGSEHISSSQIQAEDGVFQVEVNVSKEADELRLEISAYPEQRKWWQFWSSSTVAVGFIVSSDGTVEEY